MATWKKVIVSGSDISQLNNDANYLITGDTLGAAGLSGSFSGSFEGDGSGLTGVQADTLPNSLTDGNGIADFTFNGSAGASVAVEADGSTLSVGSGGVKVADAGITATQLATSVAGDGLAGGGGTALSVNVDDSSIETNSDSLRVKALGITNEMLAGSIENGKLSNSSVTIGSTAVSLGNTATTIAGLTSVTSTTFVGALTGTATTASYVDAASIDGTVANATSASHAVVADGVAANSVALGTDTTGNYVATVVTASQGGVSGVSGTGEGQAVTLSVNLIDLPEVGDDVDTGNARIVLTDGGNSDRTSNITLENFAAAFAGSGLTSAGGGKIAVNGGSGSFSGSFEGDGSGLTGVSAQVEESLLLGNGLNGGTFDGSAGVTASINLNGSTLAVGASGLSVANAGITETQLNTSVAGTGLSGGGGTALSVDYGSTAGTAAQGNTGVTFNGTANEIELTTNNFTTIGGGGTVTIGLPDDVTISGNLVVQGTASFQDTQNLAVADRFILLASGSTSAGDGGIVVQQTTQDVGEVFAYENSVTRWGIGVDFNATGSSYSPDAFMAAAINNSGNDPNGANDPGSRYNKKGNLYVASDSEDIWIYS